MVIVGKSVAEESPSRLELMDDKTVTINDWQSSGMMIVPLAADKKAETVDQTIPKTKKHMYLRMRPCTH